MQSLEKFYYNIGIRRDDRFNTIIEKDNVLIVNFDTIFERACGLRGVDKLDLIYKNWREVHPDLNGYQKLTDVLIEEIK
jgi:hypothetical protein